MSHKGAQQEGDIGAQPPAQCTEEAHAPKAELVDEDADITIFVAGEDSTVEDDREEVAEREAASANAEAGKAVAGADEQALATRDPIVEASAAAAHEAATATASTAAPAAADQEEVTNNPPEGIAPETRADKLATPQERQEEVKPEEVTNAPPQQEMGAGLAAAAVPAVNPAPVLDLLKAPLQQGILCAEPVATPISRMWLSAHLEVDKRLFVCSTAQEEFVRLAQEGGESVTFVASEDTEVTFRRLKPPMCNCNCEPVRYTFEVAVDGQKESGEIIFTEAPGCCRTLCGYEEFVGLSVRFGGEEKFTCVIPKQEACQCCRRENLSFAGCVAKCCTPCAPFVALMCLPCICCELCCLMCCAEKAPIPTGHAPFIVTSLPIHGPAGAKKPSIGQVQWVRHGGALVHTDVQVEGISLAQKLGLLMIPWLVTRFEEEPGESRVREWGAQANFVINRVPRSIEIVEFFQHLKSYNAHGLDR